MSLKQINTRAKALRKARPSMSWHDAQRKAAASLRNGGAKRKTHTPAMAKTRKRRISGIGSTAVGATIGSTRKKRKKKAGWFGATSATQGRLVQIGEIAVGMGLGAVATHMVLRPLEHKITEHFKEPLVAKAMPWGEILVGGTLFLVSGNKFIRNAGLGIMSAGVHGAMKELPIHMHSPAEAHQVNGSEYVTTRVPMNGTVRDMISGLIQQEQGYVRTPTVGGIVRNSNMAVHTPVVSGGSQYASLSRTATVGEWNDPNEDVDLFMVDRSKR